jgi:hypothetical protein
VERYRPDDSDAFELVVTAQIGVIGQPSHYADFNFDVCTPAWLVEHAAEKGFRWGHGLLLLNTWDYFVLERAIRDLCLHAEAPDPSAVLAKVGKMGRRAD